MHSVSRAEMASGRPFAWAPGLWLPYESAYSKLQKLCWLNAWDSNHLLRNAFGRQRFPTHPATWDLFYGRWTRYCKPKPHECMALEGGFARAFGSAEWMTLVSQTRRLRFCVDCLAEGFHSLLHQIEGIASCPRHMRGFRDTCPHCGTSILLALCKETIPPLPFHCPSCGKALARVFEPKRWVKSQRQMRSVARPLLPIVKWLAALSLFSVYVDAPRMSYASERWEDEKTDALVSFTVASRLKRLELPAKICRTAYRPVGLKSISRRRTHPPIPPREELEPAIQCFRAIATHLEDLARPAKRRFRSWCECLTEQPSYFPFDLPLAHELEQLRLWQLEFRNDHYAQGPANPAEVKITVFPPERYSDSKPVSGFYELVGSGYVSAMIEQRSARTPRASAASPFRIDSLRAFLHPRNDDPRNIREFCCDKAIQWTVTRGSRIFSQTYG